MLKVDIEKLINDFGVKKEAIIKHIGSNRVSFSKKLNDNSFTNNEKILIKNKWGALL